MQCSDYDDEGTRSPLLQAITFKRTPSPDPSFLPPAVYTSSPDSDRDCPGSKRKRKKPPPTQGDAVLIGFMSNGNRPDVAFEAGKEPLSGQEFEAETNSADELDEEMEDEPHDVQPEAAAETPNVPQDNIPSENEPDSRRSTSDQERCRPKLDTNSLAMKQDSPNNKEGSSVKVESAQQYPYLQRKPPSLQGDSALISFMSNGIHPDSSVDTKKRPFDSDSPKANTPATEHPNLVAESPSTVRPLHSRQYDRNQTPDTDSIATSPNIGQYTISDSQGSLMDTLPPLQKSPTQSMRSPTAQHSLPSLQSQLGSLSNAPPPPESTHPPHAPTFPPRPSFNPVNGSAYSPPQAFKTPRYPSITTISNGFHGFPTAEPSPASTVSDASHPSPRETYRPGQDPTSMSPPGKFGPRPIQSNGFTPGSDVSVQTPQSAESHQSVSSFSTETSPSSNRMSIDGDRPVLPLPSPNEPIVSGGFKCDYTGCTAPPFQTQYLLNSHANVHSQDRPHYCPVKSCPRAEPGKGFKRKNEMIRHGLVHASPGYICPFCPEREHKYPRPDNLQRHVRVHHTDKNKDDPQLREVLAQRVEGGNRGRRRRLGA
ncbi:hypothetical protein MMC30_000066 [Trapelia coarctata]|nr:hypothetical protein [Trapelia coarctata]